MTTCANIGNAVELGCAANAPVDSFGFAMLLICAGIGFGYVMVQLYLI